MTRHTHHKRSVFKRDVVAKRKRRGKSADRTRRLFLELLEDRRLLALDPQLVADVNPTFDGPGSEPDELVDVNGVVYFRASTLSTGNELWKSDGTADGTVLVRDIRVGSGDSFPNQLTNVNGTLFFTANHAKAAQLWKSDGTEAGTEVVTRWTVDYPYNGLSGLVNVWRNIVLREPAAIRRDGNCGNRTGLHDRHHDGQRHCSGAGKFDIGRGH